jgi:DNA-binding NtrC family response regulator
MDPVPIVAVGALSGAESRALIQEGVYRVVHDPRDAARLAAAAARALRYSRALQREATFDPQQMMEGVHRLVVKAARGTSSVLLIGEVGTGKRLVARAIHAGGRASAGAFVSWPLAAVAPEGPDAVRAALFGTHDAPGALELALEGSLLFDEVGLVPMEVQSSLMEVLAMQEGATASRADGSARYAVTTRFMASTSTDLLPLVGAGRMREELHSILSVLPIALPPLRERRDDIPVVADTLLTQFAARFGKPVVALAPSAVDLLQQHAWPGNIRELQEHIARAVRRAHGPALTAEDLAELRHRLAGRAPSAHTGTIDLGLSLDEALPLREMGRRAAAAAEILAIRRALKATGGNVTRAARRLQVSRIHLQKRMKLYGLRGTP